MGEKFGDKPIILELIKILSYAVTCFYAENIAKNARRMLTTSKIVKFLHWFVSLEFVKQFPLINKFNSYDKKHFAEYNEYYTTNGINAEEHSSCDNTEEHREISSSIKRGNAATVDITPITNLGWNVTRWYIIK